ncbi:hypothetical protein QBC34DRAFT_405667 [Podospora aff. communis PSN243]|uniref:RBR-type E3 ubiquitin transferase n=1 Tax=Podospora aff. communis PSN243 TaxID=3040156 RepID=A0AAV9GLW3_9PEZI|nr:hypothetical protein QBC34DRAFT_405667 [Podospora aff. communis PSN243]
MSNSEHGGAEVPDLSPGLASPSTTAGLPSAGSLTFLSYLCSRFLGRSGLLMTVLIGRDTYIPLQDKALRIEPPPYFALVYFLLPLVLLAILTTKFKSSGIPPRLKELYSASEITASKMCALALQAPRMPNSTTLGDISQMAQMPGHWEGELDIFRPEETAEEEPGESSEADKDPELFRYNPPAALTELANVTSETIVLVVRSSVEHVFQQVEAERRRTEKEATSSTEPHDSQDSTHESSNGKAPDLAPQIHLTQQPTSSSHGGSSESQSWADEQSKSPRRHRFGLRRVFQHIIEKGESSSSSAFDLSSLPAHIRHTTPPPSCSGTSPPLAPSSFTQLIYKHIKPSTPNSGSEAETIECVSCFDDLAPKSGVKTPCHTYCKPCFQQLISTSLETEAQWPPKCCLNPIPFRTITKHAGPDLVRQYRDRDEEFRVPVSDRIYCSTADCGTWIRKVDKANKTARCSAGHVMCVLCRRTPHALNTACPQDRDRIVVDRLAEEEGWRRCSKCAVLVEHREACQHMTCRCGNEFCYVCGAQWRTCACTSEMLTGIKARAAKKREERERNEREEDSWLQNALRLIEEYERETREVEERVRRARREERRRERVKREEGRVRELEGRYRELRAVLTRVNAMQRGLLSCTQEGERAEAEEREAEEREQMRRKQGGELRELKLVLDKKLADKEVEWDRDYRVRVVYERQLEQEYAASLKAFWQSKTDGEERAAQALGAYMMQNDKRWHGWSQKRDDDLARMRYEAEEEVAVREEMMETMRLRLEKKLEQRDAEREARYAAERKWFDLVVAERARMLSDIETVDRESGGVDSETSEDEDVVLFSGRVDHIPVLAM